MEESEVPNGASLDDHLSILFEQPKPFKGVKMCSILNNGRLHRDRLALGLAEIAAILRITVMRPLLSIAVVSVFVAAFSGCSTRLPGYTRDDQIKRGKIAELQETEKQHKTEKQRILAEDLITRVKVNRVRDKSGYDYPHAFQYGCLSPSKWPLRPDRIETYWTSWIAQTLDMRESISTERVNRHAARKSSETRSKRVYPIGDYGWAPQLVVDGYLTEVNQSSRKGASVTMLLSISDGWTGNEISSVLLTGRSDGRLIDFQFSDSHTTMGFDKTPDVILAVSDLLRQVADFVESNCKTAGWIGKIVDVVEPDLLVIGQGSLAGIESGMVFEAGNMKMTGETKSSLTWEYQLCALATLEITEANDSVSMGRVTGSRQNTIDRTMFVWSPETLVNASVHLDNQLHTPLEGDGAQQPQCADKKGVIDDSTSLE